MENKNEANENEITLGDFNWTIDKMERDVRNKTLYRCRFNCALSKLTFDNGLEGPRRRENPDSSEFSHCDRSSGTTSRIDGSIPI